MKVLVKGNRFAAALAAAERGIPFAFMREIPTLDATLGRVGEQFTGPVTRWHCEPGVPPYPDGTCLFFTEERVRV